MKNFKNVLSVSMVITCLWLAGCSKPKDVATRAGAITSDSGNEPVTMKLKWQTGKHYDHKMTMTQNAHLNIPQMPKPMDQEMTMSQDFSIAVQKDLPDGGHELELTFTGEKISSTMSGKTMFNFDSDTDPSQDKGNPTAPTFRRMVGAHVNYETDPEGKVTKVLNFDEFIAGISKGNPQAAAMMQGMMNKGMIQQLGMPGQGLPPTPVKIGDHWPYHTDLEAGPVGTLVMDMKYTFKGWQPHDGHKCAVLGFEGTVTTKSAVNNGGVSVSIDKGTMLGDTWFDPEVGAVRDSVSEQSMDLKISAQGRTMTSVMKQKVGIKLTDVSDIAK